MSLSITPRRMIIYCCVGAVVLACGILGNSSDDTAAVAAPHGRAAGGARAPRTALDANAAAFLTRLARRTADSGTADALFASRSWYTPPPPPPAPVAAPQPPAEPPAPTAPPLPFAFIGSYAADGDKTTYFLARGDRVYDTKAGEDIDNDYALVGADEAGLTFNYKPLNTRQTLALGAAQ